MGTCLKTTHNTLEENSSKKVVQYHVHKETCIRVGSVFAQKTDPKIGPLIRRFPEFKPSDQAEIWRGGRYGNSALDEWLDLPKDVRARCWRPRPKLVQIPSRFYRAPVYHRLPEISSSELNEILHGCFRLNSAQFHQRDR